MWQGVQNSYCLGMAAGLVGTLGSKIITRCSCDDGAAAGLQDLRAMITFQNLAAQLRSLCHGPGKASRMAPAQVIDSEVTPLHTDPPCLMLLLLTAAGIC